MPKPRKRNPNKGKRWTPEEEQDLATDHENKVPLKDLVQGYGRTKKAIVARLQRLGVMGYDPMETEEKID
jgi:hypothetical protein